MPAGGASCGGKLVEAAAAAEGVAPWKPILARAA